MVCYYIYIYIFVWFRVTRKLINLYIYEGDEHRLYIIMFMAYILGGDCDLISYLYESKHHTAN